MTELCEKVAFALAGSDDNGCPFCPGEEVKHDRITYGGEKNDSKYLRWNMADPSYAREEKKEPKTLEKNNGYPGAIKSPVLNSRYKKKDSVKGKIAFKHDKHGIYGYEAHHCISGNEILKDVWNEGILEGTGLDRIITNADKLYKGQTGYTINNAKNGVYLPSYPRKYSGKWEPMDDEVKYQIMKLAMEEGEGQAHIGCHTGHENTAGQDYPTIIKEELTAIKDRILSKKEECPFSEGADGGDNKYIPPYKINLWLDILSQNINKKLTAKNPTNWPYFISGYAKKYYKDFTKGVVDPINDFDKE